MSENHTIENISAREILDSRGDPTLEVTITLQDGTTGIASVPSGTTTGSHEVVELRDGDAGRYGGKGVQGACEHVSRDISRILKGYSVYEQRNCDEEMIQYDGTSNLRKLGANAVLGTSLACARAAANAKKIPLYRYLQEVYEHVASDGGKRGNAKIPIPLFNIFNGGKHADTNLDFQEFMIVPEGITTSFAEKVRAGSEIFHQLKSVLHKYGLDTDVGLEGGYAPNIESTPQALDMIVESIKEAGYEPGKQIQLATDVGASVLYDHDRKVYHFGLIDHDMTADQLISLYADWAKEYPFIYIEDGLMEDDWENWRKMTQEFKELSDQDVIKNRGRKFMVVGDDLLVTQVERLQAAMDQQVANSVIVKPNQVGTLTKTMEFVDLAHRNNYETVISHRSGETTDDFIADLAVAVGAGYIKTGSLSRGERLVKYNRLLYIEQDMIDAKSDN